MKERPDISPFQAERFIVHLREAARALGAGFNEAKVRTSLEAFAPEFQRYPVQLKTTSKPNGGLFYRYYDTSPADHTPRAQEAGLLETEPSPLLSLQGELLAACPGSTRGGLDFDAGFGLAKVWTFLSPMPIEEMCCRVPSLPASVRAHLGLFRHFGLEVPFCIGIDFQNRSMSIYFNWELELRTEAWLQALAYAAGGEVPSASVCYDILATQRNWGGLATTFSWERPELLRWAPYSWGLPYDEPGPDLHLPSLPPRLQVMRHAPTLNPVCLYIMSWSFGRAGSYMKLEKSYARDGIYHMLHDTKADFSRSKVHSILLPRLQAAV